MNNYKPFKDIEARTDINRNQKVTEDELSMPFWSMR